MGLLDDQREPIEGILQPIRVTWKEGQELLEILKAVQGVENAHIPIRNRDHALEPCP